MDRNVNALGMGPSSSAHRHGPPVLGRVQEWPWSPMSLLVCSPPTPCPLGPRLWFPLPVASLDAGACAVPREADDTCARTRVVRRRRIAGSPQSRGVSRRGEGLPGDGAILFVRALVEHPAGYSPLLAHKKPAGGGCGLRVIQAPRHPGSRGFGAAFPWPTRSQAYASPRPFLTPSQGWLPARAGSPLAGRVSHSLDDNQSFIETLQPLIPFDPQGLVALYYLYVLYPSAAPGTTSTTCVYLPHGAGSSGVSICTRQDLTPTFLQVPGTPRRHQPGAPVAVPG
jgi:hypothetical protein